jgi:HEAT repeat protein
MSIKEQLFDLRNGSQSDAFEAAQDLSSRKRPPLDEIIAVLNEAGNSHNREAAAYASSWIRSKRNQKPLEILLATFHKVEENPNVRAQALEGFGLQRPTERNRLWSCVESAILRGLADSSAEVRFWACYAVGTLQVKNALPKLRELSETDFEVCPNWWRVSEEATDAIEWIYGRETPSRLPLSRRTETESV